MLQQRDLDRNSLVELIMIDLEYRYRDSSVKTLSLEEYATEFPQLGPFNELPVELITEEYRARWRWGDRPGVAEYDKRFARRADVANALIAIEKDLPRVSVRVTRSGGIHFETAFLGELIVGRQGVGEPAPICVHGDNEQRKLIIASLEDLSISRVQLHASRIDIADLSIDNRSSQVPVSLHDGLVVACGQSARCRMPVTVTVANCTLVFSRA